MEREIAGTHLRAHVHTSMSLHAPACTTVGTPACTHTHTHTDQHTQWEHTMQRQQYAHAYTQTCPFPRTPWRVLTRRGPSFASIPLWVPSCHRSACQRPLHAIPLPPCPGLPSAPQDTLSAFQPGPRNSALWQCLNRHFLCMYLESGVFPTTGNGGFCSVRKHPSAAGSCIQALGGL